MSRKTDNLIRIIRDLESRYGKEDSDVCQLYARLSTLKEVEASRRRQWLTPYIRKPEIKLPAQ